MLQCKQSRKEVFYDTYCHWGFMHSVNVLEEENNTHSYIASMIFSHLTPHFYYNIQHQQENWLG
jgi:hypothetical protein